MNFISEISNLIKTLELKQEPVILVVNEFNEETANDFAAGISLAQNTGQKLFQ